MPDLQSGSAREIAKGTVEWKTNKQTKTKNTQHFTVNLNIYSQSQAKVMKKRQQQQQRRRRRRKGGVRSCGCGWRD